MDDLHHQFARTDSRKDILPKRLFLDVFGELLSYIVVNVCF